jgi:hypothetical protein
VRGSHTVAGNRVISGASRRRRPLDAEHAGRGPNQGREGASEAVLEVAPIFTDALHRIRIRDELILLTCSMVKRSFQKEVAVVIRLGDGRYATDSSQWPVRGARVQAEGEAC